MEKKVWAQLSLPREAPSWVVRPWGRPEPRGGPSRAWLAEEPLWPGAVSAIYANAELRFAAGENHLLMPGELGVLSQPPMSCRVFHAGDPEGRQLTGTYGTEAGSWLSFLERATTVSVAVSRAATMTSVYVRGSMF